MRVAQFLADHQVSFETVLHAPAFTSQRRARLMHISGRKMAKCVLLAGPSGHVLAVLPATHQIDFEAAGAVLGRPLRLATVDEMAERFCDCEWGTLSPFGQLYGVSTIVDAALDADGPLAFQAQSHFRTIRMQFRDFERLEAPRRLRFACPTP
jgi:Ala-tRNA(Pro) deacylase